MLNVHLQKKNKQQNKIQPKHWITLGLQISIKKKMQYLLNCLSVKTH